MAIVRIRRNITEDSWITQVNKDATMLDDKWHVRHVNNVTENNWALFSWDTYDISELDFENIELNFFTESFNLANTRFNLRFHNYFNAQQQTYNSYSSNVYGYINVFGAPNCTLNNGWNTITLNKTQATFPAASVGSKLKNMCSICLLFQAGQYNQLISHSTRNTNKPYIVASVNVNDPYLSNLQISQTNRDLPILLSWQGGNYTKTTIEILQNNQVVKSYVQEGAGNQFTIPDGDIKELINTTIRVKATYAPYGIIDTLETAWVERSFTPTCNKPSVSGFNVAGATNDENILTSWASSFQSWAEIEVWQGINKIASFSTNSTNHTIPNGTIKNIGSTLFKVRTVYQPTWSGGQNYLQYSSWAERTVDIRGIIPKISSLNLTGNSKDQDIVMDWRQENQKRFVVTLLQNNNPIFTKTVDSTANTFTIPKGTIINAGYVVFVVKPVYFPSWDNDKQYPSYGSDAEKGIQVIETLPALSNIALSGSDRDNPITVSWQSENQSTYELEVWQGGTKKLNYSGNTSKQHVIPAETIPTTGLTEFRVRVSFIPTTGNAKWSEWQTLSTNIVQTEPYIGVISPDGQICDRDSNILIHWTSTNQTEWSVQIHQDNTLTFEISGTTEKESFIPAGKLRTGNATITLKVGFKPKVGDTRYTQKAGAFIVQGKPPIPTITSGDNFDMTRPTIAWNGQEQMGYLLEILKENTPVYSTGWENGLITTHKLKKYLESGNYMVRVKIKNEYAIESEWGAQAISINCQIDNGILLKSSTVENGVLLEWTNEGLAFDSFYILRDGKPVKHIGEKVYNYTYIDYMVNEESVYTIRGVIDNIKHKDSNSIGICYRVNFAKLATIDQPENTLNVSLKDGKNGLQTIYTAASTSINLSGRNKPITIYGEFEDIKHDFEFVVIGQMQYNLLQNMCSRKKTFIYRDKYTKLFLTINSFNRDRILFDKYIVSAAECDFNEVVDYE